MIVVDASAIIELLLGTDRAERIALRALSDEERLHAPHLLDIEVAQALRRLVHLRSVKAVRAEQALQDFVDFAIVRHAHRDMVPRIWELRASLTAYDAAYVALGEALDAPVLTCDMKLARSHGHRARIELVA